MPLHSALTGFVELALSLAMSLLPAMLGLALLAAIRPLIVRGPDHRIMVAPAIVAGALLGLAALAVGPLPPTIGMRQVFAPGGPWDMTGLELISRRLPDALVPLDRVVFAPLATLPMLARIGAVAFMGAITLAAILPFMASHNGIAALRLALNAAICFLVALATIYVACFLVWLAGLLNYWTLAALLLIFQRWRYAG